MCNEGWKLYKYSFVNVIKVMMVMVVKVIGDEDVLGMVLILG